MPITHSAKKALRQNITRRERNLSRLTTMRDIIRKYKKLIEAKKIDEAKAILPTLYKTIDKTAKAKIIKPNKAARLKSRLSKKLTQSKSLN